MKRKRILALSTFLTFAISAQAHASTFTIVDCLSEKSTTDITLHITDFKKSEYAKLSDRVRGNNTDITEGRITTYTSERFAYSGKVGGKNLSVDVQLNSIDSNNGVLRYDGKIEKVQCFVSDTTLED